MLVQGKTNWAGLLMDELDAVGNPSGYCMEITQRFPMLPMNTQEIVSGFLSL